MKVAKLIEVTLTVRVIVDENASEDEIIQKSGFAFKHLVNEELTKHIKSIDTDIENPYGTYPTD